MLDLKYTMEPIKPILNLMSGSTDFSLYLNFGGAPITIISAQLDPSTNEIVIEA